MGEIATSSETVAGVTSNAGSPPVSGVGVEHPLNLGVPPTLAKPPLDSEGGGSEEIYVGRVFCFCWFCWLVVTTKKKKLSKGRIFVF